MQKFSVQKYKDVFGPEVAIDGPVQKNVATAKSLQTSPMKHGAKNPSMRQKIANLSSNVQPIAIGQYLN